MSPIISSYSRCEPSHQWTLSGWQSARASSTKRSRAWFLVVTVIAMCLLETPRAGPAARSPLVGRPGAEEGVSILHSSAKQTKTVSSRSPRGETLPGPPLVLPAGRLVPVLPEPLQHAAPALLRGHRTEALAVVRVEAVRGAREDHDLGFAGARCELLAHGEDALQRDAGVLCSIET